MPPKQLRGKKRRGRQKQNHVVLQQLPNGQYIVTLPRMWVDLLSLKKGAVLTFVPREKGLEIREAPSKK